MMKEMVAKEKNCSKASQSILHLSMQATQLFFEKGPPDTGNRPSRLIGESALSAGLLSLLDSVIAHSAIS